MKSFKNGVFFALTTLAVVALSGCSGATESTDALEADDEQVGASEDALLRPGACVVNTVKRNRVLVGIDAQDSVIRQPNYDWMTMRRLIIGRNTYAGAGSVALHRAVRGVRLPARADLTCVRANPPAYDVKILP